MEIAIKLGDARLPTHPAHEKCWLDGQPIEARWDGFKWGKQDRKSFLIIRTIDDFWQVRGGTDWRVWNPQAEEFKKLFSSKDSVGKFPWEFGSVGREEGPERSRDRFFDIMTLLKDGTISRDHYNKLYNHGKKTGILNLPISFFDILKYEGFDQREVMIKNQGITSGVYKIGTGGGAHYATVALFATDVNAGLQMDGDLTGEHQNEETATSVGFDFDTDTNGYLLKLTAEAGADHNGGAYGNGARILMSSGDYIRFTELVSGTGTLDDIEISNLAIDETASNAEGVRLHDGAENGVFTVNRMLLAGSSGSHTGVYVYNAATNVTITNNIIYGCGDSDEEPGIKNHHGAGGSGTVLIANNTVIGCYVGISQRRDTAISYTLVMKNNLVQDSIADDYDDFGGGYGTTAYNISEDGTSPDAAYRNMNLHDGNSCFRDYDNDDYRLLNTGDEIGDLP